MSFKEYKGFAFFIIFILSASSLSAQKEAIKFGKVSMEEMKMGIYEKDTSASAVVLSDIGSSYIEYGREWFQVVFERHRRIKILDKEGYDFANASIQIYHDNDNNKEKVSNLRGYAYNLEGGKIIRTKLEKSDIFEEKEDKNHDRIKFALPNVKEGTVIEYSYRITSDFLFKYRPWTFQSSIPTVWSEYKAKFIEYYDYQHLSQGHVPFVVNEKKESIQQFTITQQGNMSTHTAKSETYRWAAADVPAFKEEPYMASYKDYVSKIQFQLRSTHFPSNPFKPVMGTWKDLNNTFLENNSFGQLVEKSAYFKKITALLLAGESSPAKKIDKIYTHVKNHMTWNEYNALFAETNLKKPYESKQGSAAEINLILTSMLRQAGLRADPVLISTRKHGMVRQQFPIASQFNYVICAVDTDEETILVDATDPLTPLGMLPSRCINGSGWRISRTRPEWLDLAPYGKDAGTCTAQLTLTEEGTLSGKVAFSSKGYSARKARGNYLKNGEADHLKNFNKDRHWEIKKASFKNQEKINDDFIENYEVSIDEGSEVLGNIIYINPLIEGRWKENPFKAADRKFPVDFTCPWRSLNTVSLTLPEGYVIEEQPESMVIALPNKGGRYTYSIMTSGNVINITSNLTIKKSMFYVDEYPYLREFFTRLISKQSEQIVLKKVN